MSPATGDPAVEWIAIAAILSASTPPQVVLIAELGTLEAAFGRTSAVICLVADL
jgi:hypothetical protein